MPSKSKSQRAFLIRVVADKDYAKERKMSQEVARGILDEDEEHIAKDKHWADKLPDRAHSSSNESRMGDVWWNPEFLDIIVNQEIHHERLCTEGKVAEYVDAIKGKVYGFFRASSVLQGLPAKEEEISDSKIFDIINSTNRVVGTGMIDLTGVVSKLRMKTAPSPFWNGFIRQLTDYKSQLGAYADKVDRYCNQAKAIYAKCERMQPAAAATFAKAEITKIGLVAPAKPTLPLADFTLSVGPRYGMVSTPVTTTAFNVMVEHPTQSQLNQIIKLAAALDALIEDRDGYWTLDDTDELKWWDHHFPGQSEHWGPMLNLFPYAGEINGYDDSAVRRSSRGVVKAVAKMIELISK